MLTGPLPFASTIGNPKSDAAFLEALKKCAGQSTAGKGKEGKELSHAQIKKIGLKESDVAKVTREGISHLAFHPQAPHLLIATGDKQGHIALWDVDKKSEPLVGMVAPSREPLTVHCFAEWAMHCDVL